jgi:hypothetical protein
MTESLTPSNFAKWKRPVIGGVISASIAAFFMLLYFLAYRIDWFYDFLFSTLDMDMLGAGFYAPGLPFWLVRFDDLQGSISTVFSIFVWFLAGFTITYLVRKNIIAIGLWILLYISCLFGMLYIMILGMG